MEDRMILGTGVAVVEWGVAIVEWLSSPPLDCEVRGSNPAQGRNLKTKISASGAGEGVSPVQGEAN